MLPICVITEIELAKPTPEYFENKYTGCAVTEALKLQIDQELRNLVEAEQFSGEHEECKGVLRFMSYQCTHLLRRGRRPFFN